MQLRNPKVYNPSFGPEKKSFPKIYIYLILVFVAILLLLYFLFYSSFFKIKNIVISENSNPAVNQIFQELNGVNIFRFSAKNVQSQVSAQFPEVKGVKITRGLPDTLKIEFQERSPKVIWQTQDKNYLIDNNGEVYQEISSITDELAKLPIVKDDKDVSVSIGQQILSENFLGFINELNSNFNQATGFNIIRFEINETTFQVDAVTDQNWKVIFDTTRSVSDQLSDLKAFLTDHKSEVTQYIDLRVEGRVYYK